MPRPAAPQRAYWRPAIPLALALSLCGAWAARADEFSILSDSTVIGRDTGYPSGTPSQRHPPARQLDLVVEAVFFMKNLELLGLDDQSSTGEPINGETFFGVLLPLRFRYRAHERLAFELGAVLGHNFGDDDELDIAEPLLRLAYQPAPDLFLIFGTILPTHWIHDALHDDVQKLRLNAEQGFQLRADLDWLKQDIWINWRIRETRLEAEEFEVGNTTQLRPFGGALRIDAQLLWAHVGGQINSADRVEQNLALLGGASIGTEQPFGISTLDSVRLGVRYLYSSDSSRGVPNATGHGYEGFALLELRPRDDLLVRLNGSFFDGDDLIPRRGDPLYTLNEYGQLGAAAVFELIAGLRIEIGAVAQFTAGRTHFTYAVNFAWGQAFSAGFLRPRQRSTASKVSASR